MYFSPAYLSSLIVEPIRFLYANYAPAELVWNQDPSLSNIEIDTINNFNKVAIQSKPRILISRGSYSIGSMGLTDSLSAGSSSRANGIHSDQKILLVTGQSQILIEAANEGTCEKIVEVTSNFLSRTAPLIANTQGFKQFGIPLNISPCTPGKEDTEIFTTTLSFSWIKETRHTIDTDGVALKNFILQFSPQ